MSSILIRRANMVAAGSGPTPGRLPAGYTELAYLQSDGNQYINTGLKPDNTYTFDTKVAALNSSYNCVYWGCRSSGTYSSNNSQCYLSSNNSNIFLYSTSTRSNLNWDSGISPVVGTMYQFTGMTVVSTMNAMTYPITLFALNNIGNINTSLGICRIGLFIAYSNSNKVMELVPAMRDSDSIVGMYDLVSDTFLTNAGSGTFNYGTL